ncbi:MAG: YgfZ/GcvT domain-containing protein [Alphaproteobacteria bacterium]
MNDTYYTALTDRGILSITGPDSLAFLQGIVTNDIEKVSANCAVYAAILTPQGKYLHDFFVVKSGDQFLLDCPSNQLEALTKRLKMYRLRAKVEIEDLSDEFAIFSITGPNVFNAAGVTESPGNAINYDNGIAFVDPRLVELGLRTIQPVSTAIEFIKKTGFQEEILETYKTTQISLGVPDGDSGEILKQAFPLEIGFDELNAISFDKGCYVGQEVTTRMKIRKLVKKRLVPVTFNGIAPVPGTSIQYQNKEAGQVYACNGEQGIAMLGLETLANALDGGTELTTEETTLRVTKPGWFQLPD